jgi:transcriptional regulator with XRE-family HTH domain
MAMTCFGELLLEARTRARLTQKELAMKVDVHDTYISKMETGAESPPSRKVALDLAAALGIRKKSRRWLDFLLAAGVASAEDMEGFALVEAVEEEEEDQAIGDLIPSIAHAAKAIPYVPFRTTGEEIEEIKGLIASARLSEEEEEKVVKALAEITKQLLILMEMQRKTQK